MIPLTQLLFYSFQIFFQPFSPYTTFLPTTFLSYINVYTDNGKNILTVIDFWLAKKYFQPIQTILDNLHYLVFGGHPPPSFAAMELNNQTFAFLFVSRFNDPEILG